MAQFLIFLLSLYQLQTTIKSEILETPQYSFNMLAENENDLNSLFSPDVTHNLKPLENNKNSDLDDADDDHSVDEENDGVISGMSTGPYGYEQTELQFRQPIESVNIDYPHNTIALKFRHLATKTSSKQRTISDKENENRQSIEKNFMRFGRSPADFMRFGRNPADFMRFGRNPADFMRFGKRQHEEMPSVNAIDNGYYKESRARFERSNEGMRDSRGDNFMRFGRNPSNFMRFGRSSADFMRFGRNPADFMRFGRNPADFMRFGRSPADFMRFGRSPADFMRFGRNPSDFMRFGRNPSDFMRFGRNPADFMRFGRSDPKDFMRFGRSQSPKARRQTDQNFMRFGRPDNFMRFGRSSTSGGSGEDKSANFMRFGKSDQGFMRFGKNLESTADNNDDDTDSSKGNNIINSTKPATQKSKVHQMAQKMMQEHVKDTQDVDNEENNPMDKAISALYNKQQQDSAENADTLQPKMVGNADLNTDADSDLDYVFNMLSK